MKEERGQQNKKYIATTTKSGRFIQTSSDSFAIVSGMNQT
jgi:hypothetical protein